MTFWVVTVNIKLNGFISNVVSAFIFISCLIIELLHQLANGVDTLIKQDLL